MIEPFPLDPGHKGYCAPRDVAGAPFVAFHVS